MSTTASEVCNGQMQEAMEPMVKEPMPSEDINITQLPDDCLIKIFSELCYDELITVQKTCRRFYTATAYCIEEKKRIKIIIQLQLNPNHYKVQINDRFWSIFSFDQLMLLFADFRNNISSLILNGHPLAEGYPQLIVILYQMKNCCSRNLKQLTINRIKLNEIDVDDFRELFKSLQKLEIKYAFNPAQVKKCLSFCRNLKELTVYDENYVKMLDEEGIIDIWSELKKNPMLTTLKVMGSLIPTPERLNYLKKLTTLLINFKATKPTVFNQIDYVGLFQLKSLRHLELVLPKRGIAETDFLAKITGQYLATVKVLKEQNSGEKNDLFRPNNILKLITRHDE